MHPNHAAKPVHLGHPNHNQAQCRRARSTIAGCPPAAASYHTPVATSARGRHRKVDPTEPVLGSCNRLALGAQSQCAAQKSRAVASLKRNSNEFATENLLSLPADIIARAPAIVMKHDQIKNSNGKLKMQVRFVYKQVRFVRLKKCFLTIPCAWPDVVACLRCTFRLKTSPP